MSSSSSFLRASSELPGCWLRPRSLAETALRLHSAVSTLAAMAQYHVIAEGAEREVCSDW